MRKQRVVLEHEADAAFVRRHVHAGACQHAARDRMVPASSVSRPAMQRSAVVLPQPLGPSRQPISPSASTKLSAVERAPLAEAAYCVAQLKPHG